MKDSRLIRYLIIGVILTVCVFWSVSSATDEEGEKYPNDQFLATADWLKAHLEDENLIIADVRADEYFDGKLIPGAVRMPWAAFRYDNPAANLASTFVGTREAQKILGDHGITREDTVVLYDSVERDGGATASYVFWVLDILGHERKMILERGIDGWIASGGRTVGEPVSLEPLLYQAPAAEIQGNKLIDGRFIYHRLGDYYYQIIDVRSRAEYLGEKGTKGLSGEPLKLGHIPTAVNINYEAAWTDKKTKALKPYGALQQLYKGVSTNRGVIVYCNSGRRSAFSYFVLRLMGFDDVITYEPSWKEWGQPSNYFPVETAENKLTDTTLPTASAGGATRSSTRKTGNAKPSSAQGGNGEPRGGYVSCGG